MSTRMIEVAARLLLFVSILTLGATLTMTVGEEEGLARVDLSEASVQALVVGSPDGKVLYAGLGGGAAMPGGIYKSVDGGWSWEAMTVGLERKINALAIHPADPQVIYLGTEGGSMALKEYSLYRSEDGGLSWGKIPLALPASPEGRIPSVVCLAIDPEYPSILYVGTDGQGAYKVMDGGQAMLALGHELYGTRVDGITVDPVESRRVYAVTNRGLYRSDDGGGSWTAMEELPEQAVALAVAESNHRVLYAGTASMGLYRSDDGGITWQHIGRGLGLTPGVALSVTALAVDPHDENVVYAAPVYRLGTTKTHLSPLGVYVSEDGGASWRLADKGAGGLVSSLVADPASPGVVYAAMGQRKGVIRYGREAGGVGTANPLPTRILDVLREMVKELSPLRWSILVLTLLAAVAALVFSPSWLRPLLAVVRAGGRQRSRRA